MWEWGVISYEIVLLFLVILFEVIGDIKKEVVFISFCLFICLFWVWNYVLKCVS